jgi:glycosyltransferase involved in cell wall biosynthesis
VVSKAFEAEIEQQVRGSSAKTVFIPNGADLEYYEPPKLWRGCFMQGSAPDSENLFHVVFAGVFSDYTNLETLLEAAAILRDTAPEIRIHLAGGGYQFARIRELVQKNALHNVKFWGTIPKSRISKFLMEGDLSIINYRNLGIFGQVLPNKLFDYLAAGRPILAASPEGEVGRILRESGAGRVIAPEDPQALAEHILWFATHRSEGLAMGGAGNAYVRKHFNREALIQHVLDLFPRVIPIDTAKRGDAGDGNVIPFPGRQQQGR